MFNKALRIVAIAILAHFLTRVLGLLGIFRSISPSGVDNCEKLTGPELCEDITHGSQPGEYFLSCDPSRLYHNSVMDVNLPRPSDVSEGEIWKLQLQKDGESRLSKLEGTNNPGGFHPLGLALDGPTNQLLIANTPETRSASVDIYSIQDDRLHLIKSIMDPLLHSPNSVFPLPQSSMRSSDGHTPSFFFTNDHYFMTGWKKVLENNLFLPLSSLMMYDARVDKIITLLSGFAFANGVTVNSNGTLLYVAETLGRRIWKFEITIPSDERGAVKLKKVGQTQVPMAVDNLSVQDETGDVIAAGHPIGYKLLQHASSKDKANAAQPPSMVVRWKANGTAETILTDDGSTYGSSTTAIIDPLTGKLLVSSLFDSGILLCQTASQE